ncbi:bifunctional phosphoribosyl-AMP cyclohydrolase/phosphoribosyl-ATP diphosphatase HisIE|uniref:Histidine biosynthesis bifunctional protein HisIE n=1 Tax=Dendrosporobacter quercicolus TaxID=146817 RepID=A0A1G9NX69_9FIRM|nr:bifunctional phosphoribosyl-AMP cyclohydrolase/phosphoribosyl-ATP diphosphatase HisIE [Dendrosporobacter quercicolus]NSL47462.1 bifunctional phosphoribosyl-AMP cyclohydrolase/phosphoribosyl-ATP diphosphatase HisIE [Dendrosporobacter quercicolus DSM 1736]SDL90575.1 phosphoribosyl-ATP pyrophosphatase /phosphoribosyl-AMP cyclohydrolase [Dendrosporobacter quercicolus]
MNFTNIKFDANGLIPAIIQDVKSNTVLMLAYMNEQALHKTVETGLTWFYSRSRQALWHKGETSGNVQKVIDIYYDCDADSLLVKVEQTGAACHEGTFSCFSRKLGQTDSQGEKLFAPEEVYGQSPATVLHDLYHVINNRRDNPKEGSYTTYLFEKGQDKILKKVGEESAETIIASKNNDNNELLYEMADLWYHCLVLLAYHKVSPSELLAELLKRRK